MGMTISFSGSDDSFGLGMSIVRTPSTYFAVIFAMSTQGGSRILLEMDRSLHFVVDVVREILRALSATGNRKDITHEPDVDVLPFGSRKVCSDVDTCQRFVDVGVAKSVLHLPSPNVM